MAEAQQSDTGKADRPGADQRAPVLRMAVHFAAVEGASSYRPWQKFFTGLARAMRARGRPAADLEMLADYVAGIAPSAIAYDGAHHLMAPITIEHGLAAPHPFARRIKHKFADADRHKVLVQAMRRGQVTRARQYLTRRARDGRPVTALILKEAQEELSRFTGAEQVKQALADLLAEYGADMAGQSAPESASSKPRDLTSLSDDEINQKFIIAAESGDLPEVERLLADPRVNPAAGRNDVIRR